MKVSTNLSHTRKPRKLMGDAAKFLRDLGYTDEQIIAQLFPEPEKAAQDNGRDDARCFEASRE